MKTQFTLASCLLLSAVGCYAAEIPDSIDAGHKRNPISFTRTTPEVKTILEKSRPDDTGAIPVPNFVLKSANNNFIVAVGGSIDVIMGWDIGNNLYQQPGAGISFVTNSIPVPPTPGHKGDFYINPINGSVDLQITGLAGTPNEITAYLKAGTNGITKALALKKAYVTWRNLQLGLQNTLMEDGAACQPPTIDPQGPSGSLSTSAYEIAYKSKDYNGFRFAAALDLPTYSSSNGYYRGHDFPKYIGQQVDISSEQFVPDIPVWVQYTFSENNRIRLSGMLRNFHYRDVVAKKTRYTPGWAVMLSGNASPVTPLIFYYQVVYGKGIGTYIQDLSGLPFSFIPDDSHPGEMKASPMLGANVGLTWNINPKWQVNGMFSESRVWKVADYATAPDSGCNYKYALYGAVNCFYNITNYLQWGIEYVWGHKQTWDMGGAHDSRIQTQLSFSF